MGLIDFYKRTLLLWFPSKEIKEKVLHVKSSYAEKMAPIENELVKSKSDLVEKNKLQTTIFTALSNNNNRLNQLKNCFDDKAHYYAKKANLYENLKSTKKDLDIAYAQKNKAMASKNDYWKWANRNTSFLSPIRGKGGKKISTYWSIFDKYTKLDLAQFKGDIASSSAKIQRLKKLKADTSNDISRAKRNIEQAKKLCAHVKSQSGKNEIKELRKLIASSTEQTKSIEATISTIQFNITQCKVSIKTIKKEQAATVRAIKLELFEENNI